MASRSRVLGILILTAAVLGGQELPPPPVDATLIVRLAAGKSAYAIGELIPLELEFRGTSGEDFSFWSGTYDRSGRMWQERYEVSPAEGFRDPLEEYYRSGGFVGGGLGGFHPLDGTPFRLRVNLNDWVQFTEPGRYELSVTSSRLQRRSGRPGPKLTSNSVALEIQPASPEWAEAELARAARLMGRDDDDEIRAGLAILRHLGTRDAALALVRAYETVSADFRFDVLAGLVGSPFRADVVAAMEERVETGSALPASFVRDLALLRRLLDRRPDAPALAAQADRSRR